MKNVKKWVGYGVLVLVLAILLSIPAVFMGNRIYSGDVIGIAEDNLGSNDGMSYSPGGMPDVNASSGYTDGFNEESKDSYLPPSVISEDSVMPPEGGGVSVPYGDKVVRSGEMIIDSDDINKDIEELKTIILSQDGTVVNENVSGGDYSTAHLSVLVPSEKFDVLVKELKKDYSVYSFSASTSDETKIYQDTESRLKVAEEQLVAVQDLLGQAKNITEVLEIRDRSTALQQEVEYLRASLKDIDNRVEYSTLIISLQTPQTARGEYGWWENTKGMIVETFQGSLRALIIITVGLTPFIFVAGIMVALGVWIRKWFKGRKNNAE